jgi:group I intron endonuclease
MTVGIYKITNKVNGKFYVGSSANISKRWWEHRTSLIKNKHVNVHLQSSWNLHGENSFAFVLVEEVDKDTTDEELKQKEQVYLDECWDGGVNCYNMSKIANRPCNPELPVLQLNKTTKEVIREWGSATEVEKELGWARNNIGNCCRGILGTFKGYRWQYVDNSVNNYVQKETIQHGGHNKRKLVRVNSVTGAVEQEYDSLEQASRENNIKHYSNVLQVCNGTKQQTHGLVFKYLEDHQSVKSTDTTGYKCLVCGVSGFATLKALATHIQLSHKPLTSEEYTVKHLLGLSHPPKCKVCDNVPRYVAFSFKSYCKDHAVLASTIAGSKLKPRKPKPPEAPTLPENILVEGIRVGIYQLTNKGYSKDWWLEQKKLNPDLLLFYSDDWNTKQELIKSMINCRLGKSTNVYDARKLLVVEDPELTKQFLELNHISGVCRSIKSFGLVDKTSKELVCLLTLRKPLHKQEPNVIEIARFCSKQQSNIRGGFSRLLSSSVRWSVSNNYTKMISYCDLNTGTGRVYEATGFKLLKKNTGVNYWYTDGTKRYNRFKFRAQPGKTEKQIAEENGVHRVYGCGNSLYEFEINK